MKKPCVKCNKQIPTSALNCVFCSARQPPPPLDEILSGLDKLPKGDDDGFSDDLAASYATEPTLVGFSMQALAEASAKRDAGVSSAAKSEPVKPATPATEPAKRAAAESAKAPPAKEPVPAPIKDARPAPVAASAPVAPDSQPVLRRRKASASEQRARRMLQLGGVALLLLLGLPMGSISSWDRLQVLCGAPYLAFYGCLVSAVFFVLISFFPLDRFSRFGLAALLGILVVALNGWGIAGAWQSLVGAAVVGVLATQLLGQPSSLLPGRLAAGVALLLLILPGPHGMPIVGAFHMLSGGSHGRALLGLVLLLPPVLAGLALLPEPPLGRRLLAALVVSWAPLALLISGYLVGDELQMRLSFGVLGASVLAVVSLEEALRRSPRLARG